MYRRYIGGGYNRRKGQKFENYMKRLILEAAAPALIVNPLSPAMAVLVKARNTLNHFGSPWMYSVDLAAGRV